jgi:hypothetical protein
VIDPGVGEVVALSCPTPRFCPARVDGGKVASTIATPAAGATWSAPVERRGFLDYVTVACASAALCIGSEDNEVDVWDYAFDGASSSFMNTQLYGPRLSCVAAPMCVAVEIDMVNVGR